MLIWIVCREAWVSVHECIPALEKAELRNCVIGFKRNVYQCNVSRC